MAGQNNSNGRRAGTGAFKVWGPGRLPGTNGTVRFFYTDPIEVSADTAAVVGSLKILEKEDANMKVGLDVDHGPDAQAFDTFKSNLISMTTLGAAYTPPCVLVGGTKPSTEGSPNAVIRSVIKTEGNGADSSATVELWLFLKTV